MTTRALNLDPVGRTVLCAGAGPRLHSKAERLWSSGARLLWLDKVPESWRERERVNVISSATLASAPPGVNFALLALEDQAANETLAEICRAAGAFIWRADIRAPELQFPSVIERGYLSIAIDTAGRFPTVARWVRHRLEQVLPFGLGALLDTVDRLVPEALLRTPDDRRKFWDRVLSSGLAESAAQVGPEQLEASIRQLSDESLERPRPGRVFLVGAGPGDPELLTIKALRLIGEADVVLYDRLVSDAIMDLVRSDAEKIHVGKARANHSVPQDTINQMLVEHALKGRTVVRLKGGDPFIFGRGGEEIETLSEAGIGFEVVPGITAASGCSAYAGIPLTHRDHAQSVRFVTGHLKDNTANLPWDELVHKQQTLVFYMGLMGLPIISEQLIAHGMSPDTPIALVSRGTLPGQEVVAGNLANIVKRVSEQQVKAPTLLIVGDVVRLRNKLAWLGH